MLLERTVAHGSDSLTSLLSLPALAVRPQRTVAPACDGPSPSRAGHNATRRRGTQQMQRAPGPAPRSPVSQAHNIGRWTHASKFRQRLELDVRRRIDVHVCDPAPLRATAQGDAHDRAHLQPCSATVGMPGIGNGVVERPRSYSHHIGQHAHDHLRRSALEPLRRALCGRCGLGGWLLEGEPTLTSGAQRPRADFRSAKRSVLSQLNSSSGLSMLPAVWPVVVLLRPVRSQLNSPSESSWPKCP